MENNVVLEKSLAFALRTVRLHKYLVDAKKEYILSKELLTAGTSIEKHVKEAGSAESRQVFISEFGIARRKSSETEYWLQLLLFADLITGREFESVDAERVEISKTNQRDHHVDKEEWLNS